MEKQDNVWNKIAPWWVKYRVHSPPPVIEFLKNKNGKILDLGCGSGRNFQKNKGIIYGVDFSQQMLVYAKQSARKNKIRAVLKQQDISKLDFPDNFFDSALLISTLHTVPFKTKRKAVLLELNRVLKKNSEVLISVWDKTQKRFKTRPKESCICWNTPNKKLQRYLYLYEQDELIHLLESCKFRVIKKYAKTASGFSGKNIVLRCVKL